MGYYSLLLLFFGVLIIGIVYTKTNTRSLKNNILFLFIFLVYLIVFFSVHHHIARTCKILVGGDVSQVMNIIRSWGILSPVISILLMVMQAVIAPLPAFLITAANGMIFGMFFGTLVSLAGAMGGALVSFMISRWFYDRYIKKALQDKKAAEYIEKISGKHGFKLILIARLLPFVSFDLISYAAGLSTIRTRTFALATLIGMIPATVVYTMLGHEIAAMEKYSAPLVVYSTGAAVVLVIIWLVQGAARKKGKRQPH